MKQHDYLPGPTTARYLSDNAALIFRLRDLIRPCVPDDDDITIYVPAERCPDVDDSKFGDMWILPLPGKMLPAVGLRTYSLGAKQ